MIPPTVMLLWTLLWRHNGHDGVSNHQPHDCLLNHVFRHWSKNTSKLRVTGLRAWNSPAQRASNAENYSILWRHNRHILLYWSLFSEISRKDIHSVRIETFWKILPIFDIDPDLHFFQNINRDMFQISKYYMEDPFNEKCQKVFKDEYFSMIHMNIRSFPANLHHSMNYLNCFNVEFSVLCFSETVTCMHSQGTVMLVNTALIGLVEGYHYLSRNVLHTNQCRIYLYKMISWKVCLWRWIHQLVMDVKQ